MKAKLKSQAARIEKEEADEEAQQLREIQKTAVDVAKAADRHARKR